MSQPTFIRVFTQMRRPLERAVVFSFVWWIVAEADPESWLFGVPFVALATAASLGLTPSREWRIRPLGALRYAGFFARQSVAGGVDVTRRVFSPSMPIDPDIVRYRLRLPSRQAQVLFADTISLLPGTLSAGIDDTHITVHVLDRALPVAESLAEVEDRVAAVYGMTLPPAHDTLDACELTAGSAS